MTDFNINNVEEILVRFVDGQEVIYKGKGLEKLRRLVSSSPAYGEVKGRRATQQTTIVDYDDHQEDEDEDDDDLPPTHAQARGKAKKSSPAGPVVGRDGYHVSELDYTPKATNKGRSPMDIARDMQRQAESASGIKF